MLLFFMQAICRTCDLGQEKNQREYQDPTDAFRVGDIVRGKFHTLNYSQNVNSPPKLFLFA